MIANERAPGKFWISGRSLHATEDASLGYILVEHALTPSGGNSPGAELVLSCHAVELTLLPSTMESANAADVCFGTGPAAAVLAPCP